MAGFRDHPFVVAVEVLAGLAAIAGFLFFIEPIFPLNSSGHGQSPPTADPHPAPSLPPSSSDHEQSPPTADSHPVSRATLPEDYVGHWQGEGQSDTDNFLQFRISLDLRQGRVNSIIGSAYFEGNFHAGTFGSPAQYNLRLSSVSNGSIHVSEQGGFGDVVLQLEDRTITYHARNVGEPVYWVTATLSRIP
jgi:hypothetical protein